jgi:L-alanine-DL-glutamate epimerase-like enolase superfamily enzyme
MPGRICAWYSISPGPGSVEHGLKCAAPLRDFDIDWLEDPFHRDRVADYVTSVKAGAGVPIGAGDETTQPCRCAA